MTAASIGRRRSPTRSQLDDWRVFIETTEELSAILTARLHRETGLSQGDYKVLLALSESGDERVRSSELADVIGWERSRLSHHLGRMEQRGLITRVACETDNRGAEVTVTPEGASAFRRATAPHMHAIQEVFVDALDPRQIAALGDAARALHAHLRDTRAP